MKRKPRLIGLQLLPLLPPLPPSPPPPFSEFSNNDHFAACSSTTNHITIFYNAPAGTYDTTELQALAILWHARVREMEAKFNKDVKTGSNFKIQPYASLHFQLHSPYSLRKSLQRFLQNRRERRIQAATPY